GEAGARVFERERQADVALADDGHASGARLDLPGELSLHGHERSPHPCHQAASSVVARRGSLMSAGASAGLTSAAFDRRPNATTFTMSKRIRRSSHTERCFT